MKVIAKKCNEHFVSIGDKLAKEIQTNDEQCPTAHLKSSITNLNLKPSLSCRGDFTHFKKAH